MPPVAPSHCNVVAIQDNGSSGHLITLDSNFSHARANLSLKSEIFQVQFKLFSNLLFQPVGAPTSGRMFATSWV